MSNEFQLWFKSTLFEIVPGEDEAINPGCYGKSLANWLRVKLIARGYDIEDIIPEDWGWCVMCRRSPFKLWVGCGSLANSEKAPPDRPPASGRNITWTCFVRAEPSLFVRFFRRIDTIPAVRELYEVVRSILTSEPAITIIDSI